MTEKLTIITVADGETVYSYRISNLSNLGYWLSNNLGPVQYLNISQVALSTVDGTQYLHFYVKRESTNEQG